MGSTHNTTQAPSDIMESWVAAIKAIAAAYAAGQEPKAIAVEAAAYYGIEYPDSKTAAWATASQDAAAWAAGI